MTYEEQRLIGSIVSRLDAMEKSQQDIRQENRADHQQIFNELKSIAVNGCAKGVAQDKAIEKLQEQPGRIVTIGAAIVAIVGAIISWVK